MGAEDLAPCAGRAGLGLTMGAGEEGAREPLTTLTHSTALNKIKKELCTTQNIQGSPSPQTTSTTALDFAEWEGQLWRKRLGPPGL